MSCKRLLVILSLLASTWLQAQNPDVIDYINTYKELAITEMQRSGVPASITLAQGIHESMAGKSDLAQSSNNHFGIKCKSSWQGEKVYHDDDRRGECFRSYSSPVDSYTDHSDFLKNGPRYASLFTLNPEDYKEWAYGLKKAGYATNKKYPEILIKLIEDYNLNQYSLIALGRMAPEDEILAGNGKPISELGFTGSNSGPAEVETVPAPPQKDYPQGEFTINNTKVLFAKAGTSLLAIAQEKQIPLSRLLDFNDMKQEDVLANGQLLYLQRKRKTGAHEFHEVIAGETLYSICQEEGLRMESLLTYNHLQAQTMPAAGEKLFLQKTAPTMPRITEKVVMQNNLVTLDKTTASNTTTIHIVKSRETLFSIARKYGTTIAQLRQWNNLANGDLQVGQELVIQKN